ncbi:unnamed protein product [Linum trigynum]|uniref:Uncharacterized protein n=1 Tax=Linum trigynum TaxID=586398 RepID=A0AAV2DT74_9ROSI
MKLQAASGLASNGEEKMPPIVGPSPEKTMERKAASELDRPPGRRWNGAPPGNGTRKTASLAGAIEQRPSREEGGGSLCPATLGRARKGPELWGRVVIRIVGPLGQGNRAECANEQEIGYGPRSANQMVEKDHGLGSNKRSTEFSLGLTPMDQQRGLETQLISCLLGKEVGPSHQ